MGRVEGLVVDWLSGNIYWIDVKKCVIEVVLKDGYYRYILFLGCMNMLYVLVFEIRVFYFVF